MPLLARSAGSLKAQSIDPPIALANGLPGFPASILLRGECSGSATAFDTPDPAAPPLFGNPRLKSIVVMPSPRAQVSSSGDMDGWTEVRSRKARHASRSPSVRGGRRAPLRYSRRAAFNAEASRRAFLSRFKGLCLRCLSPRHRRVDCRDPLHCIKCKLPDHFARECPKNPKNIRRGGSDKERLGPAVGRGPVRERLRFPSSLPIPAIPPAHHVNPSRRSRSSHIIIESPAMEHQTALLRRHIMLLTATTKQHAASPMSMGRAIDAQLHTLPHLLCVTCHDPGDFPVHFELSAHRDNAVRLGVLTVDGTPFAIKPWHEDDHVIFQDFMLHVRVVIEKMPMQLWSLRGRRRCSASAASATGWTAIHTSAAT